MLGLFSGEDIEIVDFKPPPMEFMFEISVKYLIWSPPAVFFELGFSCTATLEFALVRTIKLFCDFLYP